MKSESPMCYSYRLGSEDTRGVKKKDLESALRRLEADLEDLEETMRFNLSHTSAHIGGGQVRRDEETLEQLRQEISRIRELLKAFE
jgi:hypothetical protein